MASNNDDYSNALCNSKQNDSLSTRKSLDKECSKDLLNQSEANLTCRQIDSATIMNSNKLNLPENKEEKKSDNIPSITSTTKQTESIGSGNEMYEISSILPETSQNSLESMNNIPSITKKVASLHVSNDRDETAFVVNVNKENESLKNILLYSSDSDENPTEKESEHIDDVASNHRKPKCVESSSDSDSDDDVIILRSQERKTINHKTSLSGYDFHDYLPENVERYSLNIDFFTEEFVHFGKIDSIVSDIVTVAASDKMPSLDLDTPLFVNQRDQIKKLMGFIFDVIGNILKPFYCIRFRNLNEIKALNLSEGQSVYYAPRIQETKYVAVGELVKMKGSDASWKDDVEVPEEFADFSDDEKEREAALKRRQKRIDTPQSMASSKKHKKYEMAMNQSNLLNTQAAQLMDAHRSYINDNRRAECIMTNVSRPSPVPAAPTLARAAIPYFNSKTGIPNLQQMPIITVKSHSNPIDNVIRHSPVSPQRTTPLHFNPSVLPPSYRPRYRLQCNPSTSKNLPGNLRQSLNASTSSAYADPPPTASWYDQTSSMTNRFRWSRPSPSGSSNAFTSSENRSNSMHRDIKQTHQASSQRQDQ